jgi:nucleoside-diphosphate-sugar epimerase
MNVLITGGAGFLGTELTARLLASGVSGRDGRARSVTRLTLLDIAPCAGASDPRVHGVVGSIDDPAVIEQALTPDTDVVFHLAAVVSGQAEVDFELGMRINFDGTRRLLERARRLGSCPRFVFASSVAVFGGNLPPLVRDDTAPAPLSSYGTQKLMSELLLADYSRRGYIDGRGLRMPTICVRPGAPNRAASSFASGIIREPLAGQDATCPVSPDSVLWLMSPTRAVDNLLHGCVLDTQALGTPRVLNLPGLSVNVRGMVAALERFAGKSVSDRVRWQPDPSVARIVDSWPGRFEATRATALGFRADADFEEIIRAHAARSPTRSPVKDS